MYGNGCTDSVFRIENMVSMYGRGNRGTGLLFQWGSQTEPSVCTMRTPLYAGPVLFIEGSTFTANQGPIEISISLNLSVQVGTSYFTLILKNSSIAFNRVTNFNSTTALLDFTRCETALFHISHNSYNATAMIITQELEKWNQVILGLALAGIALIAILITSNFTVSVGTVNGLIFYAKVQTRRDNSPRDT